MRAHPFRVIEHQRNGPSGTDGYFLQRGRLFYWAHQSGKLGQVWRVFRSNPSRQVGRSIRSGGPVFLGVVTACQTWRVKYGRVSAASESGG